MTNSHHALSPRHPLLGDFPLSHSIGRRDALIKCSAVLSLMADAFQNESEEGISFSGKSQEGFWFLLTGIADVLEVAATVEENDQHFADVTISFSADEIERLQGMADLRDCSIAETAAFLVKRCLADSKVKEAAQ